MYEPFFGLGGEAFSVAPDPRFMYLSAQHLEALRQLEIGLRGGGGFVLLTGEVGAGKTTVWRCLLEQLPPSWDVATVVNPKLGVDALLARLMEDLGVELPDAGTRDPIDALHGHLLLAHARGRRSLIVIDEAQALSVAVLEQLRLLTNLVTADRKLVQVLLIGQPELHDLLERPELEPLASRVVARYHLGALPADETRRYIAHRLAVAGNGGPPPFDDEAMARIHALSGGLPRRINVLCDRALLAAWQSRQRRVGLAQVERAAGEVFARPAPASRAADRTLPAPVVAESAPGDAVAATLPRRALFGYGTAALLGLALIASPWLRDAVGTGAGAGPQTAPLAAPGLVPTAGAADTTEGRSARVPVVAQASPATAGSPAPAAVNAAAAVAPPAAPLSVDDLGGVFGAAAADEAAAWRSLAGLWGASLGAGEPCAAAAGAGLECYRGRGGLAPVRQLQRPAILVLEDDRGRTAYALLTGLSEAEALLSLAGVERRVALAVLARNWRGEFATLWRTPPGWRGDLFVAGDSPSARWLDGRLDLVDPGGHGRPQSQRVFAFQLVQGLSPDGLAGPQTLMQLNRATGLDEPRLRTP
ncbi:MAG: AAA family ATPase [Burkholderiales bacterium]|nr:AAA family ATPase [Burkholderiales bacterium]